MIDLRAERVRRGLTLPQLAEQAGVAYHTARRVEQGKAVREDAAKQLADFLGVDPLELVPEDVAA